MREIDETNGRFLHLMDLEVLVKRIRPRRAIKQMVGDAQCVFETISARRVRVAGTQLSSELFRCEVRSTCVARPSAVSWRSPRSRQINATLMASFYIAALHQELLVVTTQSCELSALVGRERSGRIPARVDVCALPEFTTWSLDQIEIHLDSRDAAVANFAMANGLSLELR